MMSNENNVRFLERAYEDALDEGYTEEQARIIAKTRFDLELDIMDDSSYQEEDE